MSDLFSTFLALLISSPLLGLALLFVLTIDEPRIRHNNYVNGWNMEICSMPFWDYVPDWCLHGQKLNP